MPREDDSRPIKLLLQNAIDPRQQHWIEMAESLEVSSAEVSLGGKLFAHPI